MEGGRLLPPLLLHAVRWLACLAARMLRWRPACLGLAVPVHPTLRLAVPPHDDCAPVPCSPAAGAPRYFPTALPVVIVNPDNVSLELGIKEEASCGLYKGAAGDSGNAGGTGDGKAAPSPPPGAAAAGGRPALQRDSRGFMVWPQPQQHWQQQPWEQPQWQQEQRGIQLGQAKVWVPGDKAEAAEQAGPRTASVSGDDGASCSGSSMASTSSDARGAWGYQAPS